MDNNEIEVILPGKSITIKIEFFGGPMDGEYRMLRATTQEYKIPLETPAPEMVDIRLSDGAIDHEIVVPKLICQRYVREKYRRGADEFDGMTYSGEVDLQP